MSPFIRLQTLAVRLSMTLCIGLLSQTAFAGFCSTGESNVLRHEFQFLAGYSPSSPTVLGTVNNRKLLQAGFAYSHNCWKSGAVDISYTATVLPLAVVLQPDQTLSGRQIPAHSVYGISVMPMGFTFDVKRESRFGVFGETHGGVIASSEPLPIAVKDATGLNFVFDFGGGARWRLSDRRNLRMGYRFLHISNAYTTAFNPGLDNNLLYLSFSVLR